MTAPAVTPAARRLAKAAGVRPAAAQRVLDGLEVWPGTYDAVSGVALACGVVDLPPPAPRAPRRPPPRPCPACAAKDAELVALRARVAELEREADAEAALPPPPAPPCTGAEFVEAAQAAIQPRTDAEIRDLVNELEACPVAAAEPRRHERETRLLERGYDQDPPRDPFVAPRTTPQPDATTRVQERAAGRPCTVRVDLGDGVLVRAAEAAR